MNKREILTQYKNRQIKAQYYLKRYIDELKFHFELNDCHIIKILKAQISYFKAKNPLLMAFKNLYKKEN